MMKWLPVVADVVLWLAKMWRKAEQVQRPKGPDDKPAEPKRQDR